MTISAYMTWLILGCLFVTFIPRVLPFLFVRSIQMPKVVMKWLTFIPICILTALVVEGVLTESDHFIAIDWTAAVVLIPTLAVALFTKSLSLTVLAGVLLMACVRFLIGT